MKRSLLAALVVLGVGCAPESPEAPARGGDLSEVSQALTVDNGRELNGRELNGRELNGRELNGRELNGRELNGRALVGAQAGGFVLSTAQLEGSELLLTTQDGSTVRGTDAVGAILWDDGQLAVRVDAAQTDAAASDVWRYTLSRRVHGKWAPLCGTDEAGAPVAAIPLSGRWDYRQGVTGGGDHLDDGSITFACEGAALAKCVDFGYAPWRTAQQCDAAGNCFQVSLADYHQACTRMVRADYCGDGRSFTVDGTPIDLYDGIGIQTDTESWDFEAEWTPSGAACLHDARIIGGRNPGCGHALEEASCGDPAHFAEGTLLMTEAQPSHPGHHRP
jgi:hypothetical protein